MTLNCIKHGEVEAEPNRNGDVLCPKCMAESYNAFKVPKEYFIGVDWGHKDHSVSMVVTQSGRILEILKGQK